VHSILSVATHSTRLYVARDLFGEYPFEVVVKILAPPPFRAQEREQRRAMNEMLMPPGFIHQNLAEILDSDIDEKFGYYVVTRRFRYTLQDWLSDPASRPLLTLGWALDIMSKTAS
jgi:hypothetical protein